MDDHQRTRDVVLYWKSLNPVFKVDLNTDFRTRLEIPLYFSEIVKGRLPRKVALKGPGVDIDAWEVLVATKNDIVSFTGEGWRNFANAFSLEEGDSLLFKYKNKSHFKVKVISGKTSCEKESSHFVTLSTSRVPQAVPLVQNLIKMESKDETGDDHPFSWREADYDSFERPYVESRKRSSEVLLASPKRAAIIKIESKDEAGDDHPFSWREADYDSFGESRKSSEVLLASPKRAAIKIEDMSPSQSSGERFAGQIERARQDAKSIQMLTANSFYISFSRLHVSGKMKLGIPRKWWEEVIKAKKNQTVQLQSKGDERRRLHPCFCIYDESQSTATITSGWKQFVVENGLCEFDCCVFKLSKPWKENEVICLEVEIIRAID